MLLYSKFTISDSIFILLFHYYTLPIRIRQVTFIITTCSLLTGISITVFTQMYTSVVLTDILTDSTTTLFQPFNLDFDFLFICHNRLF